LRLLLPIVLALLVAIPPPARADTLDAANWGRLRGCRGGAGLTALRSAPALQAAAKRLAGGDSLRGALAAAGYAAAQSSELHLNGAVNDADVSRALTANYCSTLIDARLRDIGIARRGRETWIVLAAPVTFPGVADAAAIRRQILDLVNDARAAGRRCGGKYFAPVPPLSANASLAEAALAHSRDMAQHGEFDHRGHDGSTPAQRIDLAGYGGYRIVGENIAAGASSAAEVTQGWLASPPHCENIMDGRFTQIGIGYATNLKTAGGTYWTQDFAAPRGH
jgi:uncharacterized protein YkwD